MRKAEKIAEELRFWGEWTPELCEHLCTMAGLLDEYLDADGDTIEDVMFAAADILNVRLI